MAFRKGQKVVCVHNGIDPDQFGTNWEPGCRPKKGAVYTIAGLGEAYVGPKEPVVYLEELQNVWTDWEPIDMGYRAWRFRPVTSIKIFKDILKKVKRPERV